MNPFDTFDSWVLDKYQRFSEWTQVRYNKNCFYWAYITTHLSGMLCMAFIGIMWHQSGNDIDEFFKQWLNVSMLAFISLMEFRNLNSFKRQSAQSKPQPVHPISRIFRMAFMLFAVVDLFNLNYQGSLIFTWASISYFAACIPLPPSEVQRRQHERIGRAVVADMR